MTDVFISYAHEDQAVVRQMTKALEAEGLSVWWDHTIPPGRTWDTYIGVAIEQAKSCIVVWSESALTSKWVMEEASLCQEAGKLLPVQVDNSVPPIGFRRMQAAQLQGWDGDPSNPQWKLLVGEVHAMVATARAGRAAARLPRSQPRPARDYSPLPLRRAPASGAGPGGASPALLVGAGVAVVVAVGLLVVALTNNAGTPAPQDAVVTEAPAPPAADPAADAERRRLASQREELERLRRERDNALAAAERENQAAAEQQRQEEARRAASVIGGRWHSSRTSGFWTEFRADGTFIDSRNDTGTWIDRGGGRIRLSYPNDTDGLGTYDGVRSGANTMYMSQEADPEYSSTWTRR